MKEDVSLFAKLLKKAAEFQEDPARKAIFEKAAKDLEGKA